MPSTPTYNIPYPDGSSGYAPLQTHFQNIADGVESALLANLGGLIPFGSATQRDALYGTPATAIDRVNLANNAARWMNVDPNFGFTQRYFAPTTDSATPGYNAVNARGAGGWMPETPYERAAVVRTNASSTVPTTYGDIPGLTLSAVPCSGGKMRLTALLPWANGASGADRVVAVKALNDGVDIAPLPIQIIVPFFSSATVSTYSNHVWEFTPTAGAHTIKLQAQAAVAAAVNSVVGGFIKLEELG